MNLDELSARIAETIAEYVAGQVAPVTDPPGTINGHSIEADEDGFATVPEWDNILLDEARRADLTPKELNLISVKLPQRLDCRSVVENCTFPSPEAKLKAETNLVRRRSSGGAVAGHGGDPFTHDALLLVVDEVTNKGDRDWNISDADWAKTHYRVRDIATLVCENGAGAWSGNWNPAQDVAYFCNLYRQKVKDEIAAIHRKPEPSVPFGPRR